MMNREEEATAASPVTRSARDGFIYGDPHLPPPPHLWLRPPELHEVEEEDDAAPDPADGIRHLSPGIRAIRH
jgi:hypothetical protein